VVTEPKGNVASGKGGKKWLSEPLFSKKIEQVPCCRRRNWLPSGQTSGLNAHRVSSVRYNIGPRIRSARIKIQHVEGIIAKKRQRPVPSLSFVLPSKRWKDRRHSASCPVNTRCIWPDHSAGKATVVVICLVGNARNQQAYIVHDAELFEQIWLASEGSGWKSHQPPEGSTMHCQALLTLL